MTYLQLRVPSGLRNAVLRHHGHLIDLADALAKTGMPESMVASRIDAMAATYRDALSASLPCYPETLA